MRRKHFWGHRAEPPSLVPRGPEVFTVRHRLSDPAARNRWFWLVPIAHSFAALPIKDGPAICK